MTFGAPTQNFGPPPTNFGPPPTNFSSGCSENCWRVIDGVEGLSFGPRFSGRNSTPAQASSAFRSANADLDFSTGPDVSVNELGQPINPFTGLPVDIEFALVMRMTYPDRSWADICKNGPTPFPGYRHSGPAPEASRGSAPIRPSVSAAASPAVRDRIAPPKPKEPGKGVTIQKGLNPPRRLRAMNSLPPADTAPEMPQALTTMGRNIKQQYDNAQEKYKAYMEESRIRAHENMNKRQSNTQRREFMEHICAQQRIDMASVCMQDSGLITKDAAKEGIIKAIGAAFMSKKQRRIVLKGLGIDTALRAADALYTEESCRILLDEVIFNTCRKNAEQNDPDAFFGPGHW